MLPEGYTDWLEFAGDAWMGMATTMPNLHVFHCRVSEEHIFTVNPIRAVSAQDAANIFGSWWGVDTVEVMGYGVFRVENP